MNDHLNTSSAHKVVAEEKSKASMFKQSRIKLLIVPLALIAIWLSFPLVAIAQSETPYDLVNAVNALRASYGLEPYRIDPWLMAYAQEHSEHQAAIQSGTHLHSDGTTPKSMGLQENVAGGHYGVVTVAVVVYEIWVDWGHRHILIGYSTGDIGAGIALSDNGQVYYTVDIRPGEEIEAIVSDATPLSYAPLETNIPGEDCSIIHVVGYGQSLWSIAQAYGVTIDTIRNLNNMAGDSTIIQVGQKLLIQPACTPAMSTPTQSSTYTPSAIVEATKPIGTMIPLLTATSILPYTGQKEKGVGWIVILTISIIGLLSASIFVKRYGKIKSKPK